MYYKLLFKKLLYREVSRSKVLVEILQKRIGI
jgi:hypothetical protein